MEKKKLNMKGLGRECEESSWIIDLFYNAFVLGIREKGDVYLEQSFRPILFQVKHFKHK